MAKAKKIAKKGLAIAGTAYGTRLYLTGSKAKRKAQYSAVRRDGRAVARAFGRLHVDEGFRRAGNSRAAVGGVMYAERFATTTKRDTMSGFGSSILEHTMGAPSSKKGNAAFRAGRFAGQGAVHTAGAVRHVGRHKGAYAAGAVGVGAAAGAVIVYKRRSKNGKVHTVKRKRGGR